jgi:hypothetical protein
MQSSSSGQAVPFASRREILPPDGLLITVAGVPPSKPTLNVLQFTLPIPIPAVGEPQPTLPIRTFVPLPAMSWFAANRLFGNQIGSR